MFDTVGGEEEGEDKTNFNIFQFNSPLRIEIYITDKNYLVSSIFTRYKWNHK